LFDFIDTSPYLEYRRELPVQEWMKLIWNSLSELLVYDVKAVIFLGNDPEARVCTPWEFPVLYHYSVCWM